MKIAFRAGNPLVACSAVVAVFVLLSIHNVTSRGDAANIDDGYIDVHMHLFAASTEAMKSAGQRNQMRQTPSKSKEQTGQTDYSAAASSLVAMMDRAGVAKSIIMPPAQVPNQEGGYTYKELLDAIREYPDRLMLAAGGGELNPLIVGVDSASVTPARIAVFRKKAEAIVRAGAHAFGEMAILYFSSNATQVFMQPPADHPFYLVLADIAAENDMPIDIHWEAVPEDQVMPLMLARLSPVNPQYIESTVPALERLLAHNRSAKIVMGHAGWDNTGHQTIGLIRRLLTGHSNLYFSLKFVKKQYEPFQQGSKIAEENMTIKQEWVNLIREFPDRFMVGADETIADPTAEPGNKPPPSFDDTWSVIKQLPRAIRTKVGRDNARRLYHLEQSAFAANIQKQ